MKYILFDWTLFKKEKKGTVLFYYEEEELNKLMNSRKLERKLLSRRMAYIAGRLGSCIAPFLSRAHLFLSSRLQVLTIWQVVLSLFLYSLIAIIVRFMKTELFLHFRHTCK